MNRLKKWSRLEIKANKIRNKRWHKTYINCIISSFMFVVSQFECCLIIPVLIGRMCRSHLTSGHFSSRRCQIGRCHVSSCQMELSSVKASPSPDTWDQSMATTQMMQGSLTKLIICSKVSIQFSLSFISHTLKNANWKKNNWLTKFSIRFCQNSWALLSHFVKKVNGWLVMTWQ